MIFIPGRVIQLLTFPGVIIHELAHAIFCKLCGLAILDICYFQNDNPAGYVIHEKPVKAYQNLLICLGPFFINTILGAVIAMPAVIPIWTFSSGSPLDYVLMWLGISIAMHSFPSTGDAKVLWSSIREKGNFLLTAVTAPLVGLIYLGAAGAVVWLDALYGVVIVGVLPNLLLKALV